MLHIPLILDTLIIAETFHMYGGKNKDLNREASSDYSGSTYIILGSLE